MSKLIWCANASLLTVLIAGTSVGQQLQQTGGARQNGQIEGLVISANSNQPLRGATVRLRHPERTATPIPPAYTVSTDDSGRFLFENVEPGPYLLSAERTGFLRRDYAARADATWGTVLKISPGQILTHVNIELRRQGTIAGRVADETGEAVTNAQVWASTVTYIHGRRQLQSTNWVPVDATGGFVIAGLEPGDYYIRADKKHRPMMDCIGASDRQSDVFVTTYYPRSLDASGAVPVTVGAGEDVRGLSIVMRSSPAVTVRGQAAIPNGVRPQFIGLRKKGTNEIQDLVNHSVARTAADGTFEFCGVSPGDYIVETEHFGPEAEVNGYRHLVGRTEVIVGDKNIDDVRLLLTRPLELRGRIQIQGASGAAQDGTGAVPQITPAPTPSENANSAQGPAAGTSSAPPAANSNSAATQVPPPPKRAPDRVPRVVFAGADTVQNTAPLSQIVVTLNPDWMAYGSTSASAADGAFHFERVTPDRYRVELLSLPRGTYVQSMTFNGNDLTNQMLDLTSGSGGELNIVLSPKASDISGFLHDSDGKPYSNAIVSAWTQEQTDDPYTALSDQTGKFEIGNLPPGKYFVVAWENIDVGLATSKTFCERFRSRAASVELSDSSQSSADVPLIAPAQVTRELANYR